MLPDKPIIKFDNCLEKATKELACKANHDKCQCLHVLCNVVHCEEVEKCMF